MTGILTPCATVCQNFHMWKIMKKTNTKMLKKIFGIIKMVSTYTLFNSKGIAGSEESLMGFKTILELKREQCKPLNAKNFWDD